MGYQDAEGNSRRFERDAKLNLRRLTASDGQGMQFQSDAQGRIVVGQDTKGDHGSYEYDSAGCLSRVYRVDGQVTVYRYDSSHPMTTISVIRRAGETPKRVLFNEHDSSGRVVRQTLGDGRTYRMQYGATAKGHVLALRVTDTAGHMLDLTIGEDDYIARATPVRFPAVARAISRPN